MSVFGGIDFDSNGVYIASISEAGDYLASYTIDLACGPGDAFDRARRVAARFPARDNWTRASVLAVGVEATYSKGYQVTAALSRVQGAILACLPVELVVVPIAANRTAPDGWKDATVGKTNASKAEVKAWAIEHGVPAGLVQDVYDAFCIARATRALWATRLRAAA